jgi:hypothetical protein
VFARLHDLFARWLLMKIAISNLLNKQKVAKNELQVGQALALIFLWGQRGQEPGPSPLGDRKRPHVTHSMRL